MLLQMAFFFSFLLLHSIPVCVCVCVCVCVSHIFIHSPLDEYLGCFHVFARVTSAMNLECMYLFLLEFLSFLDILKRYIYIPV